MKFLAITAFCDKGDRYRRRNLTATLANNMSLFPESMFCVAEPVGLIPFKWILKRSAMLP